MRNGMFYRRQVVVSAVAAALGVSALAQTRTQTVALEKGWNAVWLEVQPVDASPADVFAGLPVDIVAGYATPVSEAQFVKNTAVNVQSLAGWNVWYAPHRADAPLTQLQRLNADMGLLVHALEPATLTLHGTVTGRAFRWTPNRFNLAGFTVAAQGGPTFRQFFQGSPAHNHNKIYRLANGIWRQVLNPDAEAFRPGEAFWIYCASGSDYQGPLSVKANTPMGLALNGALPGELTFRNAAPHPLGLTLALVTDEGNAALPLAAVVKAILPEASGLTSMPIDFPDGAWTQAFPEVAAGKGLSLPIALRVKDFAPGSYTGLLKATSDIGTETWIPVRVEY